MAFKAAANKLKENEPTTTTEDRSEVNCFGVWTTKEASDMKFTEEGIYGKRSTYKQKMII